ncbi:MAG: class I adenylate-forming enzyme family protein, partial [Bacillota bacterium]
QNMTGYWKKPEATKETLRNGWLHAGDMATVDEDGYLYLVDRKNDMIIRAGENIYPVEIENILYSHPQVLEAAVIGVPDDVWGEAVKAVVVPSAGESISADEIIAFCKSSLASYKCPTTVDIIDILPRNPSGKVLKRVLREPYWRQAGRHI